MSQDSTGGVLANQAGAASRAAINVSFAAIITLNSGASAPTVTYAYMLWADTTSGLLKQRDSINAGWVVIGTLGAVYFGLLSLAGGNMTGAINEARTTFNSNTATPDIWTSQGNSIAYTNTTTVTGLAAAPQAGAKRWLDITTSAASFTAGANLLIDGMSSGQTLTLNPGDRVMIEARSTTVFVLHILLASGSFAITGTGFTANPTATATYKIINGLVFLQIPRVSMSGTSNANTFTLTGIPAAIQPSATKEFSLLLCSDNGVATWADASISGGIISLFKNGVASNWTASGGKNLVTSEIFYAL